jgi:hypothetical protein
MSRGGAWAGLALALTILGVRADSAPTFEDLYGPPVGEAAGLMFQLEFDGPPAIVLGGCLDGVANCALAHAKSVVGMEVVAVDGVAVTPQAGLMRQIQRAFADKAASLTIALALRPRDGNGPPIVVEFARR